MSNKTGISISGVLKGYFQTKNNDYTNHFIAIVTGDYENKYGEVTENILEVEISKNIAPMIEQQANEMKGQAVNVWVGQECKYGIARSGKPYGFIKTYLKRDTAIERLESKTHVKAA